MLLRAAAVVGLTATLAAQTPVYIDARAGDDRNGQGTAASPFRTLTGAVAKTSGILVPDFRLRPGTYDPALGEVFPIRLPNVCTVQADPARVVPGSLPVKFATTVQVGNAFQLDGAGSQTLVMRGIATGGGMFRGLQVTTRGARSALLMLLDSCEFSHSRCVAVQVLDGATGRVFFADSLFNGPDRPLTFRTDGAAALDVQVDRCRMRNTISYGVLLEAGGRSVLDFGATNSYVYQATQGGLYAYSTGGQIRTVINHCLFAEIGMLVIGGLPSAILDSFAGGTAPRHTIGNTVFHRCKNDAPGYNAQQYTLVTCLVGQANLGGVGGNIVGVPLFVDEKKEVFQPVAGSPVVDQGTASGVLADLASHPRDSRPDIGPLEFHHGLTWHDLKASGSANPNLRLFAQVPANAGVVWFVGTAPSALAWVPGIHLAGLVLPALTATADATGLAATSMVVPRTAVPVGTEAWLQALSLQPPHFGVNASRFVMR